MTHPLDAAINAAAHSAATGGGPFGAVIVTTTGTQYPATNSVTSTTDPTAHAEVNAIRSAAAGEGTHDLTGATLYTSCYPCPMCLGAALWARVSRIVYAATPEDAADAGFDDREFYTKVTDHANLPLLIHDTGADAIKPFTAWANNPTRTTY